jgi:hypothetical protein
LAFTKEDGLVAPERLETIYHKGFDMSQGGREIDYRTVTGDYKKIKIGLKSLEDAILNVGSIADFSAKNRFNFGDKGALYKAILNNDYKTIRSFSRFFYKSNGIYQRLC